MYAATTCFDSEVSAIMVPRMKMSENVANKQGTSHLPNSNKYDLGVQQKDSNNPLFSVKTFESFHLQKDLLRGVYAMGFNSPSRIQETTLPYLLPVPPRNIIAQSQSGTGKTAAFVLAMLSHVDTTKNYPQALCLSPSLELAVQTAEVASRLARYRSDIKFRLIVKGEGYAGGKLTEHVLFGTPGKVMDWGIKFKFFNLKNISVFVLDEADIVISAQGQQDHCIRIHKQLSKNCQMVLFSATFNTEVVELAELLVPNPTILRLKREEESLDNIRQYYVKCMNEEAKYDAITNIYGGISIGQAIIFCKTRNTATWLCEKLSKDGHSVGVLTGELDVSQRLSALDRFRAGSERVLISTNVSSRGIDVEQVTIVVNFDMPVNVKGEADFETYLHRIGRTGRFGNHGIAVNLIDSDEAMQICRNIEKHFGRTISILDTDNHEDVAKLEF